MYGLGVMLDIARPKVHLTIHSSIDVRKISSEEISLISLNTLNIFFLFCNVFSAEIAMSFCLSLLYLHFLPKEAKDLSP